LGATETVLGNGEEEEVSFRGAAIGSSFTVMVSGGPPSGTNFEVSSRDVTILSSGPSARYGIISSNSSLAAFTCDDKRLIATPLSFLTLRGQVIGVPTPGLTPGMSCDSSTSGGSTGTPGDDTEESFWARNRVWIIILIVLSVLLLLGALILALFLGMRSRKKARRVTTIDDDGTLRTTTSIEDDD